MSSQNTSLIGLFYKNEGKILEGAWLARISGGYSQGMMGLWEWLLGPEGKKTLQL